MRPSTVSVSERWGHAPDENKDRQTQCRDNASSGWKKLAVIDHSAGSRPGHLGKGVGKQVGVLAHLLLRFRSRSRLEDKMSPVNSPEGKPGEGCLGFREMVGKVLNHQL